MVFHSKSVLGFHDGEANATDYDIGNGLSGTVDGMSDIVEGIDGTADDIDGTEGFVYGRMYVTNGVVLGTKARQLVTKDGRPNALVLARH